MHDLGHRLEEQRHRPRRSSWRPPAARGDDLVAEVRVEARRAVKADLALRALAEAEDLEVDRRRARRRAATPWPSGWSTDPAELRRQLDHAGRTAAVRSEQRKAKALTWLLDHVELVDEEGNPVSRDELAGPLDDARRTTRSTRATTAQRRTVMRSRRADERRRKDRGRPSNEHATRTDSGQRLPGADGRRVLQPR